MNQETVSLRGKIEEGTRTVGRKNKMNGRER